MTRAPSPAGATPKGERWRLIRRSPAGAALAALFAVSFVVRVLLVSRVHGPWIFPDELGYEQVAESIQRSGRLALYAKSGLSYSPLYPLLLAPLHGLGLSTEQAYAGTKIVNAALMSLSVFPVYGIARFVLPRRPALAVAVLCAAAPLMYYTALGMSENLAYPLFLVAAWLLLHTLAEPSRRGDAAVLLATGAACAARIQLAALLPAALTACLALGAASAPQGERVRGALRSTLREHAVLVAGSAALVAVAAIPRLTGAAAFSVAGRYSNVPGEAGLSPVHVVKLLVYHASGLVVATGVVPFVGSVVAAYLLVRRRAGGAPLVFGTTAAALTAWLLVETAYAVDAFERAGDAPRIHERYLFYLVPFFLTALMAAVRSARSRATPLLYAAGTAIAVVALLAIPFPTMINGTIVADSFSFELFANDHLTVIAHAGLVGVAVVGGLGLLLAAARARPAAVVGLVLALFICMSVLEGRRVEAAAHGERAFVTAGNYDWIDRQHLPADVAMVIGPRITDFVAQWQTDYYNRSIRRLFYTCKPSLSTDFGERRVTVGTDGVLRADGAPLRTRYAVVPSGFGVLGRVIARDRTAAEALVETTDGVLRIAPSFRPRWACP